MRVIIIVSSSRWVIALLAAAVAVLGQAPAGAAETAPDFTRVDYPVLVDAPSTVDVTDLNGDAYPDIVTGHFGGEGAVVLIGGPGGTYGEPVQVYMRYCFWGNNITTADLNGDGKKDIVLGTGGWGNKTSVCVALGRGDGTFESYTSYQADAGDPWAVAVADFTGDGKPDIATGNRVGSSVSILAGAGDGTFAAAVKYPVGGYPTSIGTGDFNADGRADLVTSNANTDDLSVLLADGSGGFAPAVSLPVGNYPQSLAVGDLNGDGKPDIAVADNIDGDVSVLMNDGSGAFGARTRYATAAAAMSVAIGDINGDGANDLAAVSKTEDRASVLMNNGTGAFSAPSQFAVGDEPYAVRIADLNADGRADLAVANYQPATVSVLLATGPASVTVAPGSVDFGSVGVGTAGSRTITVTNPHTYPVRVNSTAVTGAQSGEFAISADTCAGVTLQALAQCSVTVGFTPSAAGARTAGLALTLARESAPVNVALSGTGVATQPTQVSPERTDPGKGQLAGLVVKGPTKARKNKAVSLTLRIGNAGSGPATGVVVRAKGRGVASSVNLGTIIPGAVNSAGIKLKPRKVGKVKITFAATSADGGSTTATKTIKVRR